MCFYGINVYTATVRLAEKIARQRHFIMKYDFEVSVHDILGRQKATKTDSMRKIIEHIDERHWRTLDYFRILSSKKRLEELNGTMLSQKDSNFQAENANDSIEKFQRYLTDRLVQPFTYKNLNFVLKQQRIRDRLLKTRQDKQEKEIKNRNKKILETVNEYFPNIDIMSKQEKHKEAIEKLSRPRLPNINEKI